MPVVRRILMLLVGALLAAGCGSPVSQGGGSELPIVLVLVPDTPWTQGAGTRAPDSVIGPLARAWTLWKVTDQTEGSPSVLARGTYQDSAGYLRLPRDSGMFILEAWRHAVPSDSVVPRRAWPEAPSALLDCPAPVVGGDMVPVRPCSSLVRRSPSTADGVTPDAAFVLQMRARSVQRLRLLRSDGEPIPPASRLRLWVWDKLNDSLRFAGEFEPDASGHPVALPGARVHLVLEAWTTPHGPSASTPVPRTVAMTGGLASYLDCLQHLAPPMPPTASIHACGSPGLDPGGVRPDFWFAFSAGDALP